MPDEFDLVQQQEEQNRAQALARVRSEIAAAGKSRKDCLDCGDPIPAKRREAVPGVLRCVECQSRFERTYATR